MGIPQPAEGEAQDDETRVAPAALSPDQLVRGGGCQLLQRTRLAVLEQSPLRSNELLDCAARGARLFLLGHSLAGELSRFESGKLFPWGAGAVIWAKDVEAAAEFLRTRQGLWRTLAAPAGGEVAFSPRDYHFDYWPEPTLTVQQGRTTVLVTFGIYLALIGAGGFVVARRKPRPWLAWGWFPMTALLVTVGLGVAGTRWGADGAGLFVRSVALVGPSGTGEAAVEVTARTLGAEEYRLRMPWQDAVFSNATVPSGLGSPFRVTGSSLTVVEDRTRGTLEASGLRVGRLGQASITGEASVARQVPRVERRAGELWATNASGATLDEVGVCTREGWTAFSTWKAGAAVRLHLTKPPGWSEGYGGEARTMGERLERTFEDTCGGLAPDSFLLVSVREDPQLQAYVLEPALPRRSLNVEVVAGPLAAEGGAR